MFGLCVKKWFFDLWDNLFGVFIINTLLMIPLGGIPLLTATLGLPPDAFLAVLALVLALMGILMSVAARFAWDIARAERVEASRFLPYLAEGWLPGLVMGGISFLVVMVASVGMPFYALQDGFVSAAALGLVGWILVLWFIMSQYWFPLNAQFEKRLGKLPRKSMLLFLDNPGFSVAMFVVTLLITALSLVTFGLFPGITGLLLWHQVCLKLRMYKYDHLEAHPDTPRKSIPWDTLLELEREKVGHRTLRNLIFPWKY